jgi:hypothetical protein
LAGSFRILCSNEFNRQSIRQTVKESSQPERQDCLAAKRTEQDFGKRNSFTGRRATREKENEQGGAGEDCDGGAGEVGEGEKGGPEKIVRSRTHEIG